MKARRNYGQFCGLAAGVGVIGERWTLLIVRELLLSPQRFTNLADNLPSIGPNLLTERLKALVEAGVIEQRPVTEDGRGKSYRLTEVGEGLRPVVLAIAKWGLGFLHEGDAKGVVRAEWGFLALQSMVDRDRIPDVDETYEFRVDDRSFAIEVRGGDVTFVSGPATRPDMTITCAADTFVRIGARLLTPFDAIATGEVKVAGDVEAVKRCTRMLGLA
jgi:DNA-binding HxlR family transcriptional regulator